MAMRLTGLEVVVFAMTALLLRSFIDAVLNKKL
jgi:hypothetical protein